MKNKKSAGSIILTIFLCIAIVILAFFAVFNILFFKSPIIGISMQPTFNESLEEDMGTTFYKKSNIKDKAYVYRFGNAKLNDIVLYERTETQGNSTTKKLIIKRVVAVGGQTVDIKSDGYDYYLYVDGEKVEEEYIKDRSRMQTCYNSLLSYKLSVGLTDEDVITLADDEVFVMGDNRGKSNDSSSYGPIKRNSIKGVVAFVVPYNQNLITYTWSKIFG